ncbi:ABC transporter ATP-binding protein [Actinomyces sp. zg-332]|uniref:ATP-binding cassette domain-containing protein n=1 Tax=Actinomyces sp. zg-332 TaxID=2708340 RepID=UPI00141DFE70|nr:ABC transporter ATP-binding protein [Actinomyces sp. zg-332]QPK94179.1 ABC transporter ATP-binding protein [Actinomyces sp. zg-332]
MINIKNLQVSYGKNIVLNIGTEVKIDDSDIVGVIGSNGAGKTTLINACLGLVPYKGKIDFSVPRSDIAVHLQENHYMGTVNVKNVLKGLLGVTPGKDAKLDELVDYFDFKTCLSKKYSELSGGQQQRLTLIMVLYKDAPITFFDEVTTGLDFETRQQLMEKISNWYANKDASVLMVTHYYDEIERLANKLLILDKGRLVKYGKIDDLFAEYIGYSAVIVSGLKDSDFKDFNVIVAPENKVAVRCDSPEDEKRIYDYLLQKQANFERTNRDIELIYLNVLASEKAGV